MAKSISNRPAVLLAQMRQIQSGLEKYAEQFVPVSPTPAELDTAITELSDALEQQVEAAGAAEAATQSMYTSRENAILLTRRMRDSIYAHFGKRDARIVEFGLDTLSRRRGNGNGSDEGNE